jgi:hypothetical protein
MSRNGSGVYSLPAGNPVVTGTTISSSWANTTLSDIASALTGSIAADGQTPMTGNLQMGNNKITGLAVATASGDALSYAQAATISALTVTGNATVGGTLTLTGGLTLNGNVTVGDASTDTLTVNATSTFAAGATFSSTFSANGGATLGDASGDALTINSSAVSIPNGLNFDSNTLVIDATNNRVGVGTASPYAPLTFASSAGTAGEANKIALFASGTDPIYGFGVSGGQVDYVTGGSHVFYYRNSAFSTERMRIDSSGNLLVGTTTELAKLSVSGGKATTGIVASLVNTGSGTNSKIHYSDGTTYNWTAGTTGNNFTWSTGEYGALAGTERMRLDSSGNLQLGTTSNLGNSSKLSVQLDGTNFAASFARNTDNAFAPVVDFYKSRGSASSPTAVQNSDSIFSFRSVPYQGSAYTFLNSFAVSVDGTFTSGQNPPTRITFNTNTANGSSTERMRLDSSGNLGLGVTPSAWSASNKAIDIGNGAALATFSTNAYLTANAYYNGTNYIYKANGAAAQYAQASGAHQWFSAPSGTAGNAITFTQAMTLDASGNLGIGTTSPAAGYKLHVAGDVRIANAGSETGALQISQESTQALIQTRYNQPLLFGTGATERMRIDSSGRLLIGTTTFGGGLTLAKSDTSFRSGTNAYPFPSGNSYLMVNASSTNSQNNWIGITGEYGVSTGSANLLLQANFNNTNQQAGNYIGSEAINDSSAALTFGRMIAGASVGTAAAKSESMRIDSSGNLLVGTTSSTHDTITNGVAIVGTASVTAIGVGHVTGSGSGTNYMSFNYAGTKIGSITQNGTTAVAYNTSSDYRLKNNQAPLTGSGAFIDALKPKTWTWTADGSVGTGFIAHEVQEVSPNSVVGEKDAVDENGNPKYQAMEYGSAEFIANIIAELQDLRKRVATLESK